MLSMNIVILTAGGGTRMRSARPKALHPLAGRPLLTHVLETARALQPVKQVVVVSENADDIRRVVAVPTVPSQSRVANPCVIWRCAAYLRRNVETVDSGGRFKPLRDSDRNTRSPRGLWPHRAGFSGVRIAHCRRSGCKRR